MAKLDVDSIIKKLNLEPHPEGGFYSQSYRSHLELRDLKGFDGPRLCSTGIYFLLTSEARSHLHRIKSDEIWHFYHGDPLKIFMVDSNGEYSERVLGSRLEKEETFQFTVPAGVWFGAEVVGDGEYSLVGCTVSPGFDFSDFELAKKENMIKLYPQHKTLLERLCLI